VPKNIQTKLRCTNLAIQANDTQINWCEFYTGGFEINYGGSFISNSAYYIGVSGGAPDVDFFGTPVLDHGIVLPQFYFSANCKVNTHNTDRVVGCFFLASDWNGTFFSSGGPGQLYEGDMHGVFVGNFNKNNSGRFGYDPDAFDSISVDEWLDSIWNDEELEGLLGNYDGREIEKPPATAEIEDITIVGTAGSPLEHDYRIDIIITYDDLIEDILDDHEWPESFNPIKMLWNAPDGLEAVDYNFVYLGSGVTNLYLSVDGVPKWATNDLIDIMIPGEIMQSGNSIDADFNPEAIWAITGVSDIYEEIRVATSSVTGSLKGKGANLHDVTGD
jgi:hypothetical protein